MKRFFKITFIAFILTFISCKKEEDKIEIYLLKDRILSSEGIPLIEREGFLKTDKNLEFAKYLRYDTISKQMIYGGRFEVKTDDLLAEPFIEDEEIIEVNLNTSEFILSQKGKNKIKELKPSMKHGIQFVICVNRKPILTGYFRSNISSYILNWNYIGYDYINSSFDTKNDINFVIRKNDGYLDWKPYKINLLDYPELVESLKKSRRLSY
jgi:hypothetical protein